MPPPAWPLERYRPLLRLQARSLQIGARLRRRFDESDVVQETLVRAQRGVRHFCGGTEAELVAWLQRILANTLKDLMRRATADKQDVRREEEIAAAVGQTSNRLEQFAAARGDTPSQALRREELVVRVAAAVERLDADQREAIILREMQGLPVKEVADRMRKTEKAVAGLLLRGRKRLRELLATYQREGDDVQ
jgi:RNA polymerase sigma-70 factor, ECF subfamily